MTEAAIVERIREAAARGARLRIRGGGSKDFYGQGLDGEVLDVCAHAGIVAYEPTELFVAARAGTPLAEIERALADRGQVLGFEPPRFASATLGGTIAAGLSGPRRMQAGAVRDFMLGAQIVDGDARVLRFGGRVMKNVAGYDVSRLMAGSLGTLGVLLEATLKVLPRPEVEQTCSFACTQAQALERLAEWGRAPLPLSASAWHDGVLHVRLSGAAAAVRVAAARIGGEPIVEAGAFWDSIRDQAHAFFAGAETLWRLSVPPATPPMFETVPQLVEWNGGLRWLRGAVNVAALRAGAHAAGGHATLYRGSDVDKFNAGVFQPLPPAALALHRRVKAAFDPQRIFGIGRMYSDL